MKKQMQAVFLVLAATVLALAAPSFAAEGGKKKIVLVAGTPSHGPGDHEFNAGVQLLKKCLDQMPGVTATFHLNGWPKDPAAFDNADAIMLFMDGGGGHPAIQGDHLQQLDALMKKGVGLACVHYAVEIPKDKGGPEFLQWIGGYYETGYSINPDWKADYQNLPTHPITRGVKPFAIVDEWYYNMRFAPADAHVTPILQAIPPDGTRGTAAAKEHPGRIEVTSWAIERPDGGRGFGFTGGHYHRNWADENFRKLILNALLWVAKMDVPANGVACTLTADELTTNLDPKGGPAPKPRASAPSKITNAKFRSDIVKAGQINVDVDITGAKQLWLVVTDGGDGFGCDWADWAEPVVVGPQGETKLTDLKWKSASAGFGEVGVNKNAGGSPLRIGGKAVPFGFGTHAPSVIEFDIEGKGFTRFKAKPGLDNGGTDQGCGSTVEFMVFTEKPPASVQTASNGGGGGSGGLSPEDSLVALAAAEGLEVTEFASEPMLLKPADLDVDAYGRVWVTEGSNYRGHKGLRPDGDRILILEDTKHTGHADKATTFYQGNDVNVGLGICVLGNKVIVSCSPNVFVFTDDGTGHSAKKETLFGGIAGQQHDHGVHTFVFGPDGKLYFNMGNAGEHIRAADGKTPVVDMAGNEVSSNGKPYRQGMVFRCNMDGNEFETLAWNFRNNYEVAVDAFGTLWQSDNDDDGNRGVRINYVMEYGNYGYTDEMTGAGWGDKRTNIETDIPHRHWHQNDPGVVPNLLFTGAGSPTGLCIYEGKLLPEIFRNQMIHCEPGHNVVRSYPVKPDGAGYAAEIVNILTSKESWFRPSDVCVAPDGSIYVADWHDPGVGGHAMGDHVLETMRGRIYRIAPIGSKPSVPKLDLKTTAGCVDALLSPNQARRYLGWTKLHELGVAAEPELLKVWRGAEPRHRARALQLLTRINGKEAGYIAQAVKDPNADIRIVGLRIARELKLDVIPLVKQLAKDPSPAVRRECAIALRHNESPDAPKLWATLAQQHDGNDRWYLEALGIGADKQETKFFSAWLDAVSANWNTPAGRDIIWRSRGANVPAYLVKIITDPATPEADKPRYLRALDFIKGPEKDAALVQLLTGASGSK